eukprot:TRINITY_DN47089_c0_g1_i1.p1 TRINITY_DN47089_c0_g1~~TRINITY_DN47089_c0_g1_i1.p1  ORF type:complete len:879 (-),score=519.81 TRINITY_DN47089_c0_g1_i1:96-2732(-)
MSAAIPEDLAALLSAACAQGQVKVPGKYSKVFKSECVYSFATPEFRGGLFVNLKTFQAAAPDYVDVDARRSGASVYLHIKWVRVEKEAQEPSAQEAEEEKNNQASVTEDGVFQLDLSSADDWEFAEQYSVVVLAERERPIAWPNANLPELVRQSVEGVLASDDQGTKEEVSKYQEVREVSRYALELEQLDNGKKISPNPKDWKCEESGMTENLWLNLSTGYIGSGRERADGKGGTGAALKHYKEWKAKGKDFPLVVKLGTITPTSADVWSYAPDEDDMVLDPHLADHLAHWGINMMKLRKTEKTTAELQLDMNMKFDWAIMEESGSVLKPLHGAGYVGLKNIGNSCYINSVVQVLFTMPELHRAFVKPAATLFHQAPTNAADDFAAQFAKLGTALTTDKYTAPASALIGPDDPEVDASAGGTGIWIDGRRIVPVNGFEVAPKMFRSAAGKGHVDFSTNQQQDAHEYYQHLLSLIQRFEQRNKQAQSVVDLFSFDLEERVQCLQSNKVRYTKVRGENTLMLSILEDQATNKDELEAYRVATSAAATDDDAEHDAKRQKNSSSEATGKKQSDDAEVPPPVPKVPFEACINEWAKAETLSDFLSTATKQRGAAKRTTRLINFPAYLVVKMSRYVLNSDWTQRKINADVPAPRELDLRAYRAKGKQADEEELPEAEDKAGSAAAAQVTADPTIVAQLMSMGFSENGCKRACIATNNVNADVAMNWVFAHMEDPDFNDPPEAASAASSSAASAGVDEASVASLVSMGFESKHAVKALKATGGDVARATDWLFSRAGTLDDLDDDDGDDNKDDDKKSPERDGEGVYELLGFVSHMGPNPGSGHYVCHIVKDGKVALFNDSKVAESQNPPFGKGYLYFYKRKDYN